MNVYEECGFSSRKDYLLSLADEYGVDQRKVFMLANTLGPDEDFDGLVVALEAANDF
jgi:hypothetical protein